MELKITTVPHVTAMYRGRYIQTHLHAVGKSKNQQGVCVGVTGGWVGCRMPEEGLHLCSFCAVLSAGQDKNNGTPRKGKTSPHPPTPNNQCPAEQKAIRSLKQAEDIITGTTHKGNTTVVMDCATFDGKIRTLLVDTNTNKSQPETQHQCWKGCWMPYSCPWHKKGHSQLPCTIDCAAQ